MNVYVLQVAKELGLRGYQVEVYTSYHDPKDPQIVKLNENARVVHLKAGPYRETKESLYHYIPEFLTNLRRFQRSEGLVYDLIHSHYWLSGWAGAILAREWLVPHVTTFHTLGKTKLRARAGEREPELRLVTEKRVMESADAIVVSTSQEMEDVSRLYQVSPYKVEVVPAGVDLELFHPADMGQARKVLGLTDGRIILYVGRIEPLKGLDILIRAMALMEELDDTRLVIVGGTSGRNRELERLRTLGGELELGDVVTFTGAVKQQQLPTYYNAADVFVLPSHYESFGLVALEAMACGTPVVASRVGGIPTYMESGKTGYLVPWRCPEPFAQRIDMLLANDALRGNMGLGARAKAEGMSWGSSADRLSDFYSCLTAAALESVRGV